MSNKQSSVEWLVEQTKKDINLRLRGFDIDKALEQAKAMHKEEVKNSYISGYLDNGYYEGSEEDASKLWEDTYESNT